MKVVLFNHQLYLIRPRLFRRTTTKIDALFPDVRTASLHLIFVDDATIHDLNRRTLGRDYPTDVLSFAYHEGRFLGELYVSIDTLKRQALFYEQTLDEELNKIFIHGFLHLQGFTHDAVQDTKAMRSLEKKLLD